MYDRWRTTIYIVVAVIVLGVIYYFGTKEKRDHDFVGDTPLGAVQWRCGTVDGTRVCMRP